MNSDRLRQVEDILFRLLELPPAQRTTRLSELCAGDDELTREVGSLLAQVDTSGSFLESPALGTSLADLEPALQRDDTEDLSGQSIGPYRIEKRIASGGMGSVYAALRADGEYTQRVAIKLVKRGMDSDEILRRFRVEKQALAALSHPNIAHLVDGGVTPDGRPYLVMEFVEGVSIDEYCDAHTLSVRDRVLLLRHVCEAVRFAHQHLIVHRDLKPRNILVTAEGRPKLLDFGIAKVLSPGETILYGQTTRREEQRLTPEYASPEQLRGERAGTASDVYSLGVILYEILAGRRPYSIPGGSPSALGDLLREQAPPLPSAAAQRAEPEAAGPDHPPRDADQLALARGTSKDRLSRQLRGDLDTIVLEAMHADVARRYQSVEALIADLDRYLDGLPISARKDSLWYRTRKFGKRHAFGLSVAAGIAMLLVGSLVVVSRERDRAVNARNAEAVARARAEDALDHAEAVSSFLKRTLESADPFGLSRGRPDAKLGDILTSAGERARLEFAGRPRVLAAILGSLGRSYMGLGDYAQAERFLVDSLDLRAANANQGGTELAEGKFDLAELYSATGRNDLAAPLAEEAMDLYRRGGGSDRLVAMALNNVASISRRLGDFDKAEAKHREAIAIRQRLAALPNATMDAKLDLADSLNNLANVLREKVNREARADRSSPGSKETWDEITRLTQEAVDARASVLPSDHPLILQSRFNLAVVHLDAGRSREAIDLYSQTLETARRVYSRHVETGRAIRNFAQILQKASSEAEIEAEQRHDTDKASALKRERMVRSASLLEEAIGILAPQLVESDPVLVTARRWLGHAYRECGRAREAREQLDRAASQTAEKSRMGTDWLHLVEDQLWAAHEENDEVAIGRWAEELARLQEGKEEH